MKAVATRAVGVGVLVTAAIVLTAWLAGAFDPASLPIEPNGASGDRTAPALPESDGAERPPAAATPVATIEEQQRGPASAASQDPADPEDGERDRTAPRADFIPQKLTLHVVAATGGARLSDVVIRGESTAAAGESLEGESRGAVEWRGDSPLELAAPEGTVARVGTLHVTAAGCETVRLLVDWSSGGERRVALRPAGGVAITLAAWPESAGLQWFAYEMGPQLERMERRLADRRRGDPLQSSPSVRQRASQRGASAERSALELRDALRSLRTGEVASEEFAEQGALLADLAAERDGGSLTAEPFGWNDLAPGRWRVAAFQYEPPAIPLVACGDVWIEAGTTTELALAYVAPVPPPLVACRGTVEFGLEWFADERFVPPSRATCSQSVQRGLGWLSASWDVDLVATGTKGEWTFDGGQAWPGPLTFVLPGSGGAVQVDVPTDGSALSIRPELPAAASGEDRIPTSRPEPADLASPAAWRRWRAEQRALAGLAELEVTLRDGAAIVPFEPDYSVVVEAAGAHVASVEAAINDGDPARRDQLHHEGRATVVVRDVPGYLPSTPVPVELRPGAITSVTIPLRRRN